MEKGGEENKEELKIVNGDGTLDHRDKLLIISMFSSIVHNNFYNLLDDTAKKYIPINKKKDRNNDSSNVQGHSTIQKITHPFTSRICADEHRAFFYLMPKYNLLKFVNENNKEFKRFLNICERIKIEREEFHSFVKERTKNYPKRLGHLTEVAARYSTEKWKHKLQMVKKYPEMFVEISKIPLHTSPECHVLFHPICLLQEEGTDFTFHEDDLLKMKNIGENDKALKCLTDKEFTTSYPTVSSDPVAEELAIEHEADIVISSSALKNIADNFAPFKRTWYIPVIVKEYDIGDAVKKIVYVDKALPPTSLTAPERNQWYFKDHIRNQWNSTYEKNTMEQFSYTQHDYQSMDYVTVPIHIPEPEGQCVNSQIDLLDKIEKLCISDLETIDYSSLISSLEGLICSDQSIVNTGVLECDGRNVLLSECRNEHTADVSESKSQPSDIVEVNNEVTSLRKLNNKEEMRKRELLKHLQVTEKLIKQKDLTGTDQSNKYIAVEKNTYRFQNGDNDIKNTMFAVAKIDTENWKRDLFIIKESGSDEMNADGSGESLKDDSLIVDESDDEKLTIDESVANLTIDESMNDKSITYDYEEKQMFNVSCSENNFLSGKEKFEIKSSAQIQSQVLLPEGSSLPGKDKQTKNCKRKHNNKMIVETPVKANDHQSDNEGKLSFLRKSKNNKRRNDSLMGNPMKKRKNNKSIGEEFDNEGKLSFLRKSKNNKRRNGSLMGNPMKKRKNNKSIGEEFDNEGKLSFLRKSKNNKRRNGSLMGNPMKKCKNNKSIGEEFSDCYKDCKPQEEKKYNLRSKSVPLKPKDNSLLPPKRKSATTNKTKKQIRKLDISVTNNENMKTETEIKSDYSISRIDAEREMFFNALCLNHVKTEKEKMEVDIKNVEFYNTEQTNKVLLPDVETRNENDNTKLLAKFENKTSMEIDESKFKMEENSGKRNLMQEVISSSVSITVPYKDDQRVFHKKVQYGLWNMSLLETADSIMMKHRPQNQPLNVLLRCKVDKFMDRRQNLSSIYMMPKLEYKSEFGAEYHTRSQLIRQNVAMFFRPQTNLLRVRVDPLKAEKISYDYVPGPQIRSQKNQLVFSGLQRIYKTLKHMRTLQPGTYMLVHTDRLEAFASLLKADDAGTFNLYEKFNVDPCKIEPVKECENPLIDHTVFLPWHHAQWRIPCTFDPPHKNIRRPNFGGKTHNRLEFNSPREQ